MYGFLNEDSLQRIQNIYMGFKNYPAYAAYDIESYVYDLRAGVHALKITRNGETLNLFLFYPATNNTGKIGSIALYGLNLQGHYNAMRSSMMAFGMPISDISFDSGMEDFLDIYLEY